MPLTTKAEATEALNRILIEVVQVPRDGPLMNALMKSDVDDIRTMVSLNDMANYSLTFDRSV